MSRSVRHWCGKSVVVVTVAVVTACASDVPGGVDNGVMPAPVALTDRGVDLGSCTNLAADDTTKIAFHAYAVGVQIYRWNGATWRFVAPSAKLYADAGGNGRSALDRTFRHDGGEQGG